MPTPTVDNVKRPRAFGFGCEIDGLLFRLAPGFGAGITIETARTEAPRVDTASSPEEIVEEHGRVFARSSFDGGEGLFRAHIEGAAPNRFWDSQGVEVSPPEPGEFPEIKLSKRMRGPYLSSDIQVLVRDGIVYRLTPTFVDTNTVPALGDESVGPGVTTGVANSEMGIADNFSSFALLGAHLYIACGPSGILRGSSTPPLYEAALGSNQAANWPQWNALDCERLWAAKGRIIASDGPSLYEVASSGAAPAAILTLPEGRVWNGVAEAGEVILASATDGYVYAFTTADGTLALVGQTSFAPDVPTAVGSTRGVVVVGTQQDATGRLWSGRVGDQGVIVDQQLVREWEGGADRRPSAFGSDQSSIYAAVPDGTAMDVWRYDLTTRGLSRHRTLAAAPGAGATIAVSGGRLVLHVLGTGTYVDQDEHVSDGWLMGPLGDFFSASDKAWVGARLDARVQLGEQAELYYATDPEALRDPDSPLWSLATSLSSGSVDGEALLNNVISRQLAGMVRLRTSGMGSTTPTVSSFSFRAFSSGLSGDVIVTLPVNISDQIERRGRSRTRVRGAGAATLANLRSLEGRSVLLRLYGPKESVRGVVESVALPVDQQAIRSSSTTVALVRVRGRRTSGLASDIYGSFGSFSFGTLTLGGSSG